MTNLQSFFLGVMFALTPSLVLLALLVRGLSADGNRPD
jgi:hypothetical protein